MEIYIEKIEDGYTIQVNTMPNFPEVPDGTYFRKTEEGLVEFLREALGLEKDEKK